MGNIWEVFLFTLCLSSTGLLLLLFKWLFRDKLSARWHYFVWGVLLLRAAIPVDLRLLCFEGALNDFWMEYIRLLRIFVEREMDSLLSQPIGIKDAGVLALLHSSFYQWSWTDRLFFFYLLGVAAVLLYDAAIYAILRVQISHGREASLNLQERAAAVAAQCGIGKYGKLRVCRRFGTPFVCGFLRPVLVVPEEMEETIDEKVLLHEMLHMKHHDILVNFLLHIFLALNWFNPLAYLFCRIIRNDSEALCDQRVLERLEGRERKEYGYILLDMADSRHPSRIGTTSMANGAKNIRTRIQRIADFGCAPKGASFAAACITALLCLSAISYGAEPKYFDTSGVETPVDLASMMEMAHSFHVTSPEMAVNIYTEALQERDIIKMALIVPEDCFEEYKEWAMSQYSYPSFGGNGGAKESAYGDYAYALHDNYGKEEYLDFSFFDYKMDSGCSGMLRFSPVFLKEGTVQPEPLTFFRLEREEERNWSLRITGRGEAAGRERGSALRQRQIEDAMRESAETEEMKQFGDWRYLETFYCESRNIPFTKWDFSYIFGQDEAEREFSEEVYLNVEMGVLLEYAGDPKELPEIFGQGIVYCICPQEMEEEAFFPKGENGTIKFTGGWGSSPDEKYSYRTTRLDQSWEADGYCLGWKGQEAIYLYNTTDWGRNGQITRIDEAIIPFELRIYGIYETEERRILTIPLEGGFFHEGNG